MFFYFILLFIFYVLKCCTTYDRKHKRKLLKCKRRLNRLLFFNVFIDLIISGFLAFTIMMILNLKNVYPVSKSGENIAWVTSHLLRVLIYGIFPSFAIYASFFASHERLESDQFKRRFGSITQEMKLDNVWSRSYFLVFMLRRIFFASLAFQIKTTGTYQIIAMAYANLFIFIYVSNVDRFQDPTLRKLQIGEEFLNCLVCL